MHNSTFKSTIQSKILRYPHPQLEASINCVGHPHPTLRYCDKVTLIVALGFILLYLDLFWGRGAQRSKTFILSNHLPCITFSCYLPPRRSFIPFPPETPWPSHFIFRDSSFHSMYLLYLPLLITLLCPNLHHNHFLGKIAIAAWIIHALNVYVASCDHGIYYLFFCLNQLWACNVGLLVCIKNCENYICPWIMVVFLYISTIVRSPAPTLPILHNVHYLPPCIYWCLIAVVELCVSKLSIWFCVDHGDYV